MCQFNHYSNEFPPHNGTYLNKLKRTSGSKMGGWEARTNKSPTPMQGQDKELQLLPMALRKAPYSSHPSALLLPAALKENHTHGSPLSCCVMVFFQQQPRKLECFIEKFILPVCKTSLWLHLVLPSPPFSPAYLLCHQTHTHLSTPSLLPRRGIGSTINVYTSIELY